MTEHTTDTIVTTIGILVAGFMLSVTLYACDGNHREYTLKRLCIDGTESEIAASTKGRQAVSEETCRNLFGTKKDQNL